MNVYQHANITYIRTSELPDSEASIVEHWINGQTRPLIPELGEKQDAVYSWDYARFKGWFETGVEVWD